MKIENQRLFIIGDPKWNTASRATGAQAAGWEVHWSASFWGQDLPAWRRVPQYRLRDGPDVYRYNKALLNGALKSRPAIAWVEDAMFIYPSTLEAIRHETGAMLACAYSDDPRDPAKKSRHFEQSIKKYDIIFTTKDELIQRYADLGCRVPAKFWKGFDPERIFPIQINAEEREKYTSRIAFIGHADFVRGHSMRQTPLEALARSIPGTKIWGQSWKKVPWPPELKNVIHPYQIDGLEYTKAICSAKVVVQIPSRLAHDTHSSRSVEIPACRTLMLAERTSDHQILFEEDKEAVFFNSIPELVDKAKFYVSHDNIRQKIADSGYERCLRSGYSNYDRMQQMLGLVDRVRQGMWI